MAKSYADAGYFARNLRAIEALSDQESFRLWFPNPCQRALPQAADGDSCLDNAFDLI
jgi:hypothetical protein